MGEPEPVDFFVSYTNADQPWAEWIAWVLEEAGISTLIQAWDFGAGANFVLEMDKAARVSQRTLAVLSPAFLESRFVRPEVAAAFREDPEGKDRKLLPVKVRECNPDGLLGSVGYVDLVSLEPGAARERLLTAARLVRAKPAQRPPFPGAAAPVSETMSRRVEFPPAAADARVDAAVSEVRSRLKAEHEHRRSGGARRMVGLRLRSRDAVFFDREAARAELQRAIASPETGLVLVIGAPGVGKTALASWVLARLEAEDSPVDGIAYLSARTRGLSFERLYSDIATLLGGDARQELLSRASDAPEERVHELLTHLQDGSWVMLLDNLEDALDHDGELADPALRLFVDRAVASGSGLTLIITSRTEPGIPPAALLRTSRVEFEYELPEEHAVELLRRLDPDGRANLRDASYDDAAQAAAVAFRIPRALELVASLRRIGVALGGFYDRADVVRDLASAAIDELDADRRRAIESLAVLGRAVPSQALSFMLAPDLPGVDAEALLRDLARSGLVSLDPAQRTVALHPVDGEVALRRMSPSARRALHRRAADWWHRLRIPIERRLAIPDLEPHAEEFQQLMLAGEVDAAADVVSDLDVQYRVVGWDARLVLSMREQLEGGLGDPRRQMLHEFGMGQVHIVLGPGDLAVARLDAAMKLAQELGDERAERTYLSWLGNAYRVGGDHETAALLLEDAVGRHRIAGDLEAEAEWLPSLALASAYAGDPEGAATAAQSALERASDDAGRAAALDALALADYAQKQWVQAIEHAELSIALYEKVGIADGAGYTENVLGMARFRIGDRDGARRALEKASEIGAQIGNPRLEGFAEFNLARVLDEQSARTYALRARTLLDSSSGDSRQAAEALVAALDPSADSVSRQQALGRCSAAASQVPDLLA